MSSSFIATASVDSFAAWFRLRPKLLPKSEPPVLPPDLTLSSFAKGSGLNVVPSLNGCDPKIPPGAASCFGAGNIVSVSIDWSEGGAGGAWDAGVDANMDFAPGVDPKEANPPFAAKLAKPLWPAVADEGVVELPNTLLLTEAPRPAKPDCPNAGDAEEVDPEVHGDALMPRREDWPKASDVGLPNTGAAGAGLLPKVL